MTKEANLTIKSVLEVAAQLEEAMPRRQFNPFGINDFYGFRMIEVPVRMVPKLQIRTEFKYCSDEFRAEMDSWLLGMFGAEEECPIPKDTYFMLGDYGILARPEGIVNLKGIVV